MWSQLNRYVPADDPACSDAHRRILARLSEYTALIVAPLNLRPTAAALLAADDERIEVRISTPGAHVVLTIAPEGDLAAEVFFLRMLAGKLLPVPRLIAHDLSCTLVPFTYTIESYAGGVPLDRLDDGPLVRVAARQVGRTLRRAHQIAAPGFGRPTTTGRWSARGWSEVLASWLAQRETLTRGAEVLGAEGVAALRAATLDHPALALEQPRVIHSAVEPARALVTVGDSAQLEMLTRPGAIVGGDPLFDLAHGTLPRHPAAFRQGLLEGYSAAGALASDQEERLRRLRLLLHTADTLWHAEAAAVARLPGDVAEALRSFATSYR
jgi:Phosphotransferase enzyme family